MAKRKTRNYSFKNSKRIPSDKMTEVNGVKIPSVPGSCYHAIICALAESKDKFCPWQKLVKLVEKYIRMYGGVSSWNKFVDKDNVKPIVQRIKENTHTLTRAGRDCYGYRLHEQGMCIYFFKDGSILYTDGKFISNENGYNVKFPDGKKLQVRYRGTTMTFVEYKKFLELNYIDKSCRILDYKGIKKQRLIDASSQILEDSSVKVCVVLSDSYDQNTATRLEKIGLIVEDALDNELIGRVPSENLSELMKDKDVVEVQQA